MMVVDRIVVEVHVSLGLRARKVVLHHALRAEAAGTSAYATANTGPGGARADSRCRLLHVYV